MKQIFLLINWLSDNWFKVFLYSLLVIYTIVLAVYLNIRWYGNLN